MATFATVDTTLLLLSGGASGSGMTFFQAAKTQVVFFHKLSSFGHIHISKLSTVPSRMRSFTICTRAGRRRIADWFFFCLTHERLWLEALSTLLLLLLLAGLAAIVGTACHILFLLILSQL